MPAIHSTAIIDRSVELADDVRVGAYTVIQGRVSIGPGSTIESHCVIKGHTVIGENCRIGPAANVGLDPQHLGYDGKETSLLIGDNTVIRESVSIHRSLKPGEEHATRLGNRCFLMGSSHVAHDCRLGDDVVLANAAVLGGHVTIGDRVFLGGMCGVHQFCQIGRLAIVAGNESISRDVPPFSAVRYGGLKGYNAVGCKRSGMPAESIHVIRAAFRCLHSNRTLPKALEAIRALRSQVPEINELVEFITASKRGIQPSLHFLNREIREDGD